MVVLNRRQEASSAHEDNTSSENTSDNETSAQIDLNVDSLPDISSQESKPSSENEDEKRAQQTQMNPSGLRTNKSYVQDTLPTHVPFNIGPGLRYTTPYQRRYAFKKIPKENPTDRPYRYNVSHESETESPNAPLPQPQVSRKPAFSPTKKQKKELKLAEKEHEARRQREVDAQLLSETREDDNTDATGDAGEHGPIVVSGQPSSDHETAGMMAQKRLQGAKGRQVKNVAQRATGTVFIESQGTCQATEQTRTSPRKHKVATPQNEAHAEAGTDNDDGDKDDRQPEEINKFFQVATTQSKRKRDRPRKVIPNPEEANDVASNAAAVNTTTRRQTAAARNDIHADATSDEDLPRKRVTRSSRSKAPAEQTNIQGGSANANAENTPPKRGDETRRSTRLGGFATESLRARINDPDARQGAATITGLRISQLGYSPDVSEKNHSSENAVEQVEQRASNKRKLVQKANSMKKRQRQEQSDDEDGNENAENYRNVVVLDDEEANDEDDKEDDLIAEQPSFLYGQIPTLNEIFRAARKLEEEREEGEEEEEENNTDSDTYDPIVKEVLRLCRSTSDRLLHVQNHTGENSTGETDPAIQLQGLHSIAKNLWTNDPGKAKRARKSIVTREIYQVVIPKTIELVKAFCLYYMALDRPEITRDHLRVLNSLIGLIITIEENSKKLPKPDWSRPVLGPVRNKIIAPLKKVCEAFKRAEKGYFAQDRMDEKRVKAERERIINEQRRELARLEHQQHMEELTQRRVEAAIREEEEEEAAAEASRQTRRINDKWNMLHLVRMIAEGGMIRPVKREHLVNHRHSAWDIDHNGEPFERVSGFIRRVGPIPFLIQRARKQQWSNEETLALHEALRLNSGEFVFETIFQRLCRRGGILHRFNVTEIVTTAADLKTYLVATTPPGMMPEPWVRAIPVWTGSQSSLRTNTIFGGEADVEVDVDLGLDESFEERDERDERRERDDWDDLVEV